MSAYPMLQNRSPRIIASFVFTIVLLWALNVSAQLDSARLTPKSIKVLTDSLAKQLNRYYIDRDAAVKMGEAVRKNFKAGKYNAVHDAHVLAGILTRDLRSVHNDEHLHVQYYPAVARELSGDIEDVPAMVAAKLQMEQEQNFGFRKVEILDGNLGYIEISKFSRLNKYSRATADAAFQLLKNSKAIIIDLRYGLGGSPEMMTYILSRFYRERLHVSDIYIRSENTTLAYYTSPDSSHRPFNQMPLYVLTSYKTFSAAEALVYTLQQTGRAIIVGEKTRGGAHTVTFRNLSGGFVCDMPFGVARDPKSGKNWEGKGITPDVISPNENALKTAALHYLEQAIEKETDQVIVSKLRWQQALYTDAPASLQDSAALRQFTGTFGSGCITVEKGCLYYQKTGMAKLPLQALSPALLRIKSNNQFIIEVLRDSSGEVSAISTHYDDGRSEYARRIR